VTHKLVFTAPMELGRFASSVITPRCYTTGGGSCATYIFPHNLPLSPRFLPYGSKRKIERETDLENRREILSLRGFIYPSLLIHGGVGLVRVGGHAGAPTKPRESGVYDSDGVGYLSYARGSCISRSGGGICHGMRDVLQDRIRCAITPISPLSATLL
jgi:hypothetical protein